MEKLMTFILNPNPSKTWKVIRFILHWLTIPIKITIIPLISLAMYVYMFSKKTRKINNLPDKETRKSYFKEIFNNLPIFKNGHIELHANRVPYYQLPNGVNHNDDHQGARHGTYAFLMSKLGRRTSYVDRALSLHFHNKYGVCRGFKYHPDGNIQFNFNTVSGDQLLGLCMAMLDCKDFICKEEFEKSTLGIINADYAILQPNGIKSKSAMWQPGVETFGAQALTILATLKIATKLGSKDAKREYSKLLYLYGYGLLSLFPLTYLPFKRNYFNDHNCIIAAYILAKSSKGLGKFYWSFIALYVWSLSFNWYNGYFTGLVNDLLPGIISDDYIEKCKAYLYEEMPLTYSRNFGESMKANEFPVKFNKMNQGEFHPDEDHKIHVPRDTDHKERSGLGWLAHAIMIDTEECKEFL